MDDDEHYEQWCEEFKYLGGRVNLLHTRVQMWEAIDGELVRMQRPGSGFVVAVFRPIVGEAQGVLVRRLLDKDKRTHSLVRLVGQMAKHHTVLTRTRFVDQWQEDLVEEANQAFDALAGRPGRDYLPRGPLLQLRDAIAAAGAEIQESVSQMVAHDQIEPTAQPFTWGQLERAINGLSVQYVNVGKILKGGYYEPVPILPPEWREAFKDGFFGPGAPRYETRHLIDRDDVDAG